MPLHALLNSQGFAQNFQHHPKAPGANPSANPSANPNPSAHPNPKAHPKANRKNVKRLGVKKPPKNNSVSCRFEDEITEGACRRMAYRGGVTRIQKAVYKKVLKEMDAYFDPIVKAAGLLTTCRNKKTITTDDVKNGYEKSLTRRMTVIFRKED